MDDQELHVTWFKETEIDRHLGARAVRLRAKPIHAKMAGSDPWARYEAWRTTGVITRNSNVMRMLPGFLIGTAIFAVAVGVETIMDKKSSKH